MTANWVNQTIWTGDNLYIMRGMNSASVDLIYLDPPFNSKANYAAPIGSKAAGAAFKDTWTLSDVDAEWVNLMEAKHPALHRVLLAAMTPSDKSYLAYMAVRLLEMRRLLKPAGSIYLHCDPTMSHYLKLVMDAVFGKRNFVGEIVWRRHNARSTGKRWPRIHDTIFCVAKSNRFRYSPAKIPGDTLKVPHTLITGPGGKKYQTYELTGAGSTIDGESGQPWRGYDPTSMGRHWATSHAKMDEWDRAGLIHWPRKSGSRGGFPRRRAAEPFAPERREVTVGDVWTDIDRINQSAKERVGYPTQKPLALLRRIIEASSHPGDVVFDPFAGCATACIAAEQLGREWVGIDISPKAAELVERRMRDELGLFYQGAHRTDIPKRTDLGKLPPYRSHRQTLYGQQEGNCAGCASHFEARHLEVDHIISRRKGGTDHMDNLQLLCGSCNRIKGDRGMEYLRVKLQL